MEGTTSGSDEVNLGVEIGVVFQYFAKVEVAAINITSGSLKIGDSIRILGATTDFTQQIESTPIFANGLSSIFTP